MSVKTIPGGVLIEEEDGSPFAVADTLVFPDGSVTFDGSIAHIRDVPQGFIGCSLTKSAVQAIATGATGANVTFNGEAYDTDGLHDNSSNTSRITIPAGMGGKWLLGGSAAIVSIGDGVDLQVTLWKNGSAISNPFAGARAYQGSAGSPILTWSQPVEVAAGDYLEMHVNHSHGSDRDVRESSAGTTFWAYKLDSGRVGQGIGARAITNATLDLTSSVETAVPFAGADDFDTDGFHDPTTNNTRLTIPAGLGGLYVMGGHIAYTANTTGDRYAQVRKGGSTVLAYQRQTALDAAGNASIVGVTTVALLAAGEYVELQALQDSGGSTVDATSAVFWIARLDSGSGPLSGEIVQVRTANSTADDATTAVTMQDSSLSLAFTPKFSDSILHVTVDGECQAYRSAGTPVVRYQWVGILNSTNSVELCRSVRGRNVITADADQAASFQAIALKGLYTVNSTAARTFKLQHMSGEVTNVTSQISGARTGGIIMTIMEVRP